MAAFSLKGSFDILVVTGWNLTVLSLFPVFLQGLALMAYLIPRISMFFSTFIFVVLILSPIPVLVLAGFSDLWFDFRSRIRSNPEA